MTDLENSLRDQLAQAEQRHQEQIADMHAKHKEEIAELHERHKEEVTEAIVAAQRNILAQLQPFLSTLSVSQRSVTMSSLDDSSTYVLTGSTPRLPGDYHHSTRIAFVEFTVVIAKGEMLLWMLLVLHFCSASHVDKAP
nr:hypothetical protein CFP56_30258 [Quercus suber]